MIYQDEDGLCDLDCPRLPGAHQIENAGTAVAAIRAAGLQLDNAALSAGLAGAKWPARMQRLTKGPLVALARSALHDEPEIWLDGGHNPHAGRAIASLMADMEARSPKPLVMISGMQANKDATGYFAPFAGIARKVWCVAANHDGVMQPQEVAAAACAAGLEAEPCASLDAAMSKACAQMQNEPPRLLISGSLYLAGDILQENA